MAFNIGGVRYIAVRGRFDGRSDIVNVYNLQKVDGGSISDADWVDDALEWTTAILTLLKAIQTTLMVWSSFRSGDLNNAWVSGSVSLTPPITGEVAGDTSPLGAAMLLYGGVGTSRRMVRKFYGPIAEAVVNASGQLTGTALTTGVALADFLTTDYVAANGTYRYGTATPGTSDFAFPLGMILSGTPAYQRRRRPGTGS